VYDPAVFVHTPFVEQPCVPAVHSFTSLHVTPSPVKPLRHEHEYDPVVFVHVASAEQPPLFVAHSFTSLQTTPSPA
jgi:hypothetical protein